MSKTPKRTLLTTITSAASDSFEEPYPKDESDEVKKQWMDRWVAHWFVVAEQYRQQMLKDGLTETAAKIQEHIDFNRRLHPL